MELLVSRARAEEPNYAGLEHKYEGAGFSEAQAQNILEMRLQRLTGMQREELFRELFDLIRDIARLRDILVQRVAACSPSSRRSCARFATATRTSGARRSPARCRRSPARI